ncbi:MAG: DUF6172 family protein [Verrucomicrobiota bacterium]|nr:DUF6172 family protein [Verrucomicrobiota bacterium]
MKKTFQLTHPKIKYPRMVDAVKNEVRKYIKRERRKELPEGVDYWDFDCRFGDTEADAKAVHLSELDKCINDIEARELLSFYVEILAKEGVRAKPEAVVPEEPPMPVLPRMKTFGEE